MNTQNNAKPELTYAQLTEQVARLTHAVNNLLQAGVTGREMAAAARAQLSQAAELDRRAVVLRMLATANNGQPGHMTTKEIMAKTGWTKSQVWHYCQDLNTKDKVIIRRGKTQPGGKRGPDVVYHADAALLA